MHETNICNGLKIDDTATSNELVKDTMLLQYKLQERMNTIREKSEVEKASAALYWMQCAMIEADELYEWSRKNSRADLAKAHKEKCMEAIDILHFVYNVGIELGIDPETVETDLKYVGLYTDNCLGYSEISLTWLAELNKSQAALLNLLPWKTWKTYTDIKLDEHKINNAFSSLVWTTLNICFMLGMPLDKIYSYYLAKNAENHARQNRGY